MSRRFSEEQTIRFVKLYRELEPLWNLSHPDYKKRSIRLACVERIIQEMNLSDFSEKDVMIKIRCLRSTYSQEVNKIQKSMIENESGHIYQPLLKWFPDMDYVMRNCGTSRLKAAITNFEFSENDLEYFKEEIVVTPVEIEILQQQNEALENQNKELCTRKKSSGNQSQNYTPPLRFSEDQTIRFVKLYKDYEQLWNINHPDYKNKSVRIACLEKIIDEMNLSNFGPRDAAMKIKNLRSTYTQELIKIQKSLTEDGSDNNIYQPLLKWFPDMDYVMSKCGNSKAKSLMDLDYPDFYMREEVIETTDLEPYQQLQVQPEVLLNSEENTRKFRRQQKRVVPKSLTKTSSTNDQYHNFAISKVSEAVRELTSLTRTLRTQAIQNEKVEDECDIVGRHVALQLRELPPAVRLTAQLDIQKVLCNCRLNLLEINHSDPDSQV